MSVNGNGLNGNGKHPNLTNGVPKGHPLYEEKDLSPEEMRKKTKEMRIANAYRRTTLESQALMEAFSWFGGDQGFGFGGTDQTEVFQRMRNQAIGGMPPAQPNDRRGGRKWPLWQTDTERQRLLQASRVLCATNDFAKGLLRNHCNYTIGKGFSYKAGIKNDKPFVPPPELDDPMQIEQVRKDYVMEKKGMQKIVDAVQRWIDDFCERCNWNSAAASNDVYPDGSVAAASSTKERESHWRVDRDGEAIIRLFYKRDGTVEIRFVGPEVIWGTPAGESEDTGWTYGIQHVVEEDYDEEGNLVERSIDLERIKAYFIRPHALGREWNRRDEDNQSDGQGEIVSAAEIIHIKDPWEDGEVKRGTPLFAYETFDAIVRATNLQRNISITSSVQAATAEVWVHKIGTKSSIEAMAAGLPGVRPGVNGMGDDNGAVRQRIIPGQIRRVPAGQEPVADPATTQVPNYMQAAAGDLRQAGAGHSMAEYMISGDSSNSNFASTQEAGTPFVRSGEARQEHFKTNFERLMWRVVRHAVKMGKLPREALTLVNIHVEAPEIHKNNEGELAQARNINLQNKVTSPQIEIAKLGNEVDQVKADWREWDKDMQPQQPGGAPGAPGAPPGAGGPPGAMPPGAGAPAGAAPPPGAGGAAPAPGGMPPGAEAGGAAGGDPNDPLAGVPQEDLSAEFAAQQAREGAGGGAEGAPGAEGAEDEEAVDAKRSEAAKKGWAHRPDRKAEDEDKFSTVAESREWRGNDALRWFRVPVDILSAL